MLIAAEEFPAARRGFVIGVIQAFSSLGSVLCAALVPALLATSLGWRAVYFVGVIPLLLLAWARRGLRETRRLASRWRPEFRAQGRAFTALLPLIAAGLVRARIPETAGREREDTSTLDGR
jgi:MFS family permease